MKEAERRTHLLYLARIEEVTGRAEQHSAVELAGQESVRCRSEGSRAVGNEAHLGVVWVR